MIDEGRGGEGGFDALVDEFGDLDGAFVGSVEGGDFEAVADF